MAAPIICVLFYCRYYSLIIYLFRTFQLTIRVLAFSPCNNKRFYVHSVRLNMSSVWRLTFGVLILSDTARQYFVSAWNCLRLVSFIHFDIYWRTNFLACFFLRLSWVIKLFIRSLCFLILLHSDSRWIYVCGPWGHLWLAPPLSVLVRECPGNWSPVSSISPPFGFVAVKIGVQIT